MAQNVVGEFSDCYRYRDEWGYRILVLDGSSQSPDKALVRYRTIEAGIRRQSGKPTLLDLSVGNMFCEARAEPVQRLHVVTDPRYAIWARQAGRVSLSEHVQLIEQFVEHVMDSGWILEQPELAPFRVAPPRIRNGRTVGWLPTTGCGQLARYPVLDIAAGTDFVVVGKGAMARRAATSLEQAFSRCFPGSSVRSAVVSCSGKVSPSAVSLVLLDDRKDLAQNHEARDILRDAEAGGSRFKLAKASSLLNPYPTQNIAYDLFQVAGGRPWEPAIPQPSFCSMDAGHSVEQGKSRWVKVESDARQRIFDIKAFVTPLAEHIPEDCVGALWPLQDGAIACRDGRLSQERGSWEARAAAENRQLIEAKKSPKSILWRADGGRIMPAEFGDAIVDDHGEVLLQTAPQNVADYLHPVRLATRSGQAVEMATAFLHQYAMPGLSLFHMSRLPGTLYFADLISKLTSDGWPKVIGRGFRLPSLVP
ncbi:hypothetical protein [Luteimonas sp. SDU82]|uniref:hypothetical protein n=1 Tax=Luteimonas sp. SDU82 TaxID=3422592 RepID=UPI003EBA49FD